MRKFLIIGFLFLTIIVNGQDKIKIEESDYANQQVEMADVMRDNGKIYVVVGVVTVILVVLLGYLITVDRKVTRLEKRLETSDKNHSA